MRTTAIPERSVQEALAEYAMRLFKLERRRPLPSLGGTVMIFRRETLKALIATLIAMTVLAAQAHAQAPAWPARPVRVVLGLSPGSGSDLLARGLAQRLTIQWGQSVVVDNRPGANTIIATEAVARAAPDGYTLLFGLDHSFTINPHLYAKLPYDPDKDFAPITLLTTFGTVLLANPALPANSVAELVAIARSQPGKFTYGSVGAGSQMHLLSEMLNNKAGIRIVHIPYKGVPQMMTAVLSGEVDLAWAGMFQARGTVAGKRLKALAYSASKRSPMMPEVPTFVELGYPDVEKTVWYGLFAPAATPRSLIDRIHGDVRRLLAEPEFREKELLSRGYEPSGLGPEEFAALVRRETVAHGAMVRVSGARIE